MTASPLARVVAVLLVLAAATACGTRRPITDQPTTDLDRKLSTFAWIEEGNLVTLIVGTRAARYRDESNYMPLELAIANRGLKQLTLTRESFTLIDEQGNRYPAASPEELIGGYEFLDLDTQRLAELDEIIFNRFAAFTRYPSKFSPTRTPVPGRSNIVRDLVSLPKFGYLVDYVYFPRPATGIKDHRFELFVDAPELVDPVFVKFEVR